MRPATDTPYQSAAEHLADELRMLDCVIREFWRAMPVTSRGKTAPEASRDAQRHSSDVAASWGGADVSRARSLAPELASEIAGLRAEIDGRIAVTLRRADDAPFLPVLAFRRLFHLDEFEWLVWLAVAAPHLDRRYRELYVWLHGDVDQAQASPAALRELFADGVAHADGTHLMAFLYRHSANQRWRLVRRGGEVSESLSVDPGLVHYLQGVGGIAADCAEFLRLDAVLETESDESPEFPDAASDPCAHLIANLERQSEAASYLIFFEGRAGSGRGRAARRLSAHLGRPLLRLDWPVFLESALSSARGQSRTQAIIELSRRVARECLLHDATLFVAGLAEEAGQDSRTAHGAQEGESEFAARFSPQRPEHSSAPEQIAIRELSHGCAICIVACAPGSRFAAAPEVRSPRVEFGDPGHHERRELWRAALSRFEIRLPGDGLSVEDLAGLYRFNAGTMATALRAARDLALARSPDGSVRDSDLIAACRAQCRHRLRDLATSVRPAGGWDDLVVPEETRRQLRDIYIHFKNRDRVFDDWEFRGRIGASRGINALFAGPPGTGKTMAAGLIAGLLNLEIFKIELSGVVSKYIGETEKNLNAIFREAAVSNSVLFFDEADALFGKRSEVSSSHDRYANIETAYLLQKMEEFDGITILATNLLQNIDEAFLRRLHVVIDFPFPDESDRRRIWAGMLPPRAPVAGDVDLDFLAERLRVAGGNIKNIALAAALHAAEEDTAIHMEHFLSAARREYEKIGKPYVEREFAREAL